MGSFGVSPRAEITVDLVECRVKSERIDEPFVIDEYVRWRLLEGLDDIGISLKHEVAIEDFEARRPEYLPTTALVFSKFCLGIRAIAAAWRVQRQSNTSSLGRERGRKVRQPHGG